MSTSLNVRTPRRLAMKGPRERPRQRWSVRLAWTALVGLLAIALPLFLCMAVWCDVAYYGIWAWEILHGRVLEKELNAFCKPPAMAWILSIPLGLVGWRPEVIRLIDVGIVTGIIYLLVRWLKPLGLSHAGRVWTAVALYGFYFSTGEWCHAQPDTWMLLPALGALYFRRQQVVDQLAARGTLRDTLTTAVAEGFLWGLACLFKPFVVVPGGLAWFLSTMLVWRHRTGTARRLGLSTLGILAGGLTAGGIWMAWLWLGGGWSYYWADFQIWSSGYYKLGPSFERRTIFVFTQFFPWGLVNVPGLVIAVGLIWRTVIARHLPARFGVRARLIQEGLLAALYLGWLVVGNYIQFQMGYHLISPLFLGITLFAGHCPVIFRQARLARRRWVLVRIPFGRLAVRSFVGWVLLLAVVGLIAAQHPLLRPKRLALWPRCLREGNTTEVQDDLAQAIQQWCVVKINGVQFNLGGNWYLRPPKWDDLARVADFLRKEHVRDGEVVCFGTHETALLLDLDIAPPSRYLFPYALTTMYPEKLDLLCREMSRHIERQRFVVSDVEEMFWSELPPSPDQRDFALPGDFPPDMAQTFPWYEPVVFRSGPYRVHQITGPIKALYEFK